MSTASPFNDNTTATSAWLPRDENDELLFLIRDITFAIVPMGALLGSFVVVNSVKRVRELSRSSANFGKKKKKKESWIVAKLKSQYAPPMVICANGFTMLAMGLLWMVAYFDVGGEAFCDLGQRVMAAFYVLALWTTYVLFEIRRISTGTENLKGIRHTIMQTVRLCTLGVPGFAIAGYLTASGIYLPDVGQCIQVVNPTATVPFGIADGMLSMGHITLFIFAVRQKSNFTVSAVRFGNKIKPHVPSSKKNKNKIVLTNRDLASPQNDGANRIRAIAKRNLHLALVTVASTAVSMLVTSWANMASPPIDSPEARSYLYLRHFSYLVGAIDANVNSISILIMTSSWQPICLKKINGKITATVAAAHQDKESDVSTLGGGD